MSKYRHQVERAAIAYLAKHKLPYSYRFGYMTCDGNPRFSYEYIRGNRVLCGVDFEFLPGDLDNADEIIGKAVAVMQKRIAEKYPGLYD